jgi:tRNA nucleotidyltransferase (CCA-adding enzyme)
VLPHPGGVEETALPHIQRQGRKLVRALEAFGVLGCHCSLSDEAFIVLETALVDLPDQKLHRGPAAWDDGALEFLKRYPRAALRDGRFWALKPPRHADIASAVQALLPSAKVEEGLAKGAEPLPPT